MLVYKMLSDIERVWRDQLFTISAKIYYASNYDRFKVNRKRLCMEKGRQSVKVITKILSILKAFVRLRM